MRRPRSQRRRQVQRSPRRTRRPRSQRRRQVQGSPRRMPVSQAVRPRSQRRRQVQRGPRRMPRKRDVQTSSRRSVVPRSTKLMPVSQAGARVFRRHRLRYTVASFRRHQGHHPCRRHAISARQPENLILRVRVSLTGRRRTTSRKHLGGRNDGKACNFVHVVSWPFACCW